MTVYLISNFASVVQGLTLVTIIATEKLAKQPRVMIKSQECEM